MGDKKTRGLSGVTLLMFVIFVFAALWFTNQFEQKEKQLSWNTFEKLIVSEDVTEVVVRQNKNVPTGRLEIQVGDAKNGDVRYLYV